MALSLLWVLVFALVHGFVHIRKRFAARQHSGLELNEDEELPEPKGHIQSLGGGVIFSYRIARLLSCVALLCLSVVQLIRNKHWNEELGRKESVHRIGLTISYVSACNTNARVRF